LLGIWMFCTDALKFVYIPCRDPAY
jgi:hypothetical protein